jgi:transcriptional regulator with XRE-family HTH domain
MVVNRDAEKDLGLVLSYLTGRKLTLDEVLAAVGMSRSTYYDRQGRGTLTTTDTLLHAARNLDLNPVDLLIRYGRIAPTDVADYLEGEEERPFGLRTATSPTPANPPERPRRRRRRRSALSALTPRPDAPPL